MRHQAAKHLPYSPEQLFALVGDVERYPQFVPGIATLRTWNLQAPSAGIETVDAEAGVGFGPFRERFATRVRRDANAGRIEVDLISGPFHRLKNTWTFIAVPGGGTDVTFDIDFELKSRLLEGLLAANFPSAVGRVMAAFDARAAELYGEG